MTMLSACGGGPPAAPTAIPASVARPQQPTPELKRDKPVYGSDVLSPTVIILDTPDEKTPELPEIDTSPAPSYTVLFELPPSALGLATGGATIYAEPGGAVVESVPAGGLVTVTGYSADADFLAVYTDAGNSGWVPIAQLKLFGADDLTVVERALSPAPIATMLAEAMEPLATSALDAAMAAMTPDAPEATSTPQP